MKTLQKSKKNLEDPRLASISSKRLTSNITLSLAQVLISGVLLFFLYRLLLKEIGASHLGLWSLILASSSAARLSELGITGSVVKFIARYRTLGAPHKVRLIIETSAISVALAVATLLLLAKPLIEMVICSSITIKELIPLAVEILPIALVAFWVAAISGVFQASLDGVQQASTRSILMMIANIIFFISALIFVPKDGLIALAYCQLFQSLFLLISTWIALKFNLENLPIFPYAWSGNLFKEMLSYSVNLQVSSIASMLLDPVTKILMSRFGGLEYTAYYEMANQMVIKARSLIVSANQVLTPVFAELHESAPEKIRLLFAQSYDIVFISSIIIYTSLIAWTPFISIIWIGHFEPFFFLSASVLATTYFINTLEVPAHFVNLGTGHLKVITLSQILMSITNISLGLLLGFFYGAHGVLCASSLALTIASLIILIETALRYDLHLKKLFPKGARKASFLIIIITTSFSYINYGNPTKIISAILTSALTLLVAGLLLRNHPLFNIINRRLIKKPL